MRLALVTAGFHRLGAAIAARLAEEGWTLALHGRKAESPDVALAAALTRAGVQYAAEVDPITKEKVYVPKSDRERRMHKALMQWKFPANRELCEDALREAGRADLIKYLPKAGFFDRHRRGAVGGDKESVDWDEHSELDVCA